MTTIISYIKCLLEFVYIEQLYISFPMYKTRKQFGLVLQPIKVNTYRQYDLYRSKIRLFQL